MQLECTSSLNANNGVIQDTAKGVKEAGRRGVGGFLYKQVSAPVIHVLYEID